VSKLAEIFSLKPEDEKKLHPYALKRLSDWRADILHEVPQLQQLDIDEITADANAFQNTAEKAKASKCKAELGEWLKSCMAIGDNYSPYPYDTNVIDAMLQKIFSNRSL